MKIKELIYDLAKWDPNIRIKLSYNGCVYGCEFYYKMRDDGVLIIMPIETYKEDE